MAALAPNQGGGTEPPNFAPKKRSEGSIRSVVTDKVLLNGYRLQIDRDAPTVYKYELKFIAIWPDGREGDITRGPKNDVSNEGRRNLLWEMFQLLIASDDSFFGSGPNRAYEYVYDCGINMYSKQQLMQRNEERKFDMEMRKISDKRYGFIARCVQRVEARLLAVETLSLHDKAAIEEAEGNRAVVQFFEVLSSQPIIAGGNHHVWPHKMFEKESGQSLRGDPRVLKSGMEKSVRFVGDSIQDAQPMLQIDPKKAAFFPNGSLVQFLDEFLQCDKLEDAIYNPRYFSKAMKQLKNLVVETTHLDHNRQFAINGLTTQRAAQVNFEYEGEQTTVEQYFKNKYGIHLKFAELPCAVEVTKGRSRDGQQKKVKNFYPLEVLNIADGQRVSIQKQTPALVEQMIRQCQALPRDFQRLNQEQRQKAEIDPRNAFFEAFGIRPDTELQRVHAEQVFAPAIVYGGQNREEPHRGDLNWKLPPQRRFVVSAEPSRWAAVIFQRGVHKGACEDFLVQLVKAANNRGFAIQKPYRYGNWDDTSVEFLRERLTEYRSEEIKYVMFFTGEKLDPVHNTMKWLEAQSGIVTQHVSRMTMEKGISNRGAHMVIDNVLMKMHLKWGGVNFGLSTAREMQGANPGIRHDIVAKDWLSQDRMIIGIDLSHAGPQTLYQRQVGEAVTDPTVVGMAYTVGEPVRMRGSYWLQEPRQVIVQDLKKYIKEAIDDFAVQVGKPPRSVVLYRNGVSEGEYRKVILEEFTQVKEAVTEFSERNNTQPPPMALIVAQRTSNYRIVPQKVDPHATPYKQNVPAGVIVDRAVMHPALTDFLMVGHKAIQGTARPVRYTTLVDELDLPLEHLEYITYHLCYTHGIVCSPVSVPGPLYAAGELAKRGRNNWSQYNHNDTASEASGESGGRFRHDGSETFFEDRSRELKPKTRDTKFWA